MRLFLFERYFIRALENPIYLKVSMSHILTSLPDSNESSLALSSLFSGNKHMDYRLFDILFSYFLSYYGHLWPTQSICELPDRRKIPIELHLAFSREKSHPGNLAALYGSILAARKGFRHQATQLRFVPLAALLASNSGGVAPGNRRRLHPIRSATRCPQSAPHMSDCSSAMPASHIAFASRCSGSEYSNARQSPSHSGAGASAKACDGCL